MPQLFLIIPQQLYTSAGHNQSKPRAILTNGYQTGHSVTRELLSSSDRDLHSLGEIMSQIRAGKVLAIKILG